MTPRAASMPRCRHSRARTRTTRSALSKPLNKLGHVIASVGAQAPIRPQDASWKLELYLLWDFGDGSFWTGW